MIFVEMGALIANTEDPYLPRRTSNSFAVIVLSGKEIKDLTASVKCIFPHFAFNPISPKQKGRIHGLAQRATTVAFGDIGLKAVEWGKITSQQIEVARIAMMRHIKRGGKVFIRIFPIRRSRPSHWKFVKVKVRGRQLAGVLRFNEAA